MFLASAGAAQAQSRYSAAAERFAEALLQHGRDHYGAVHTPLFVHIIDLRTLEIPKQRTPAEWRAEMAGWREDRNYLMWGKDRSSVAWAQDSNLLWDTETIRLLYALTEAGGDKKFRAAADDYLRYFLDHAVSPTTGLFAWGEHVAYNVVEDRVNGKRHELQHRNPLWEELWRIHPGAVRNEIEALYRCHISDKGTMAYDRHANYWNGLPERDQATILGYAGTFADAFAFLSQKTGDEKYAKWGRGLMLAFQSKANDFGIYPDNWTDRQAREQPLQFPPRPGLETTMYSAYERTRDVRWLDDANRYLDSTWRAFAGDFRKNYKARDEILTFGAGAARGFRLTGNARFRDMALEMGGLALRAGTPRTQMASSMAARLNLLTDLYDVTGDRRWLEAARREGDHALRAFVHPSGLIRGTAVIDRPDYYDAIQGPGALALALYRLGQFDAEAARPSPVSPREQPVAASFDDWTFPASASNAKGATISVRIHAGRVERAVLHYTYGNRVGMEDTQPAVTNGQYTFRTAPPGIAFIGEVSFAVEAFTATGRTLSPWKRLRLETEETAGPREGTIRFAAIPMRLRGVSSAEPVYGRVRRWLPPGVQPVPSGWVSPGLFFQLQGVTTAESIDVDYLPEDTWRLMEPTLTLAYWNGREWVRVPSRREGRTVSAPWRRAEHWTLLGEDRVLWRAPGRETGPALADLDGDGTLEVATTLFQPAQFLSSTGQVLATLPLDPPIRPVNNSSSPLVLRVDGRPTIIVGAPSGYLYAFDAKGARLWRAEVGGEILGAPSAGALLKGRQTGIAVSWGGGVSVFDRKGGPVWQTTLPVAATSTPVVIDLDGDGLEEIVVNAEDRIVAMAGSNGSELWAFRSPGRKLSLPAAGQLTRGAAPAIVFGDDVGAVYALSHTGSLLWRQDRLFGPREVPEPVEDYAVVSEVGMADLSGTGERRIVVTTRAGETVCLSARGERLWQFTSYERRVGTSLNNGGRLAFADLDGDGRTEVVVAQQDSFIHVLDSAGNLKWRYLGYFWYHFAPSVGDLAGNGELNILFTSPEEGGTYALRTGVQGPRGRAPWPMTRGGPGRTNCAPW